MIVNENQDRFELIYGPIGQGGLSSTEGIQRGHMALHARGLARAAGATGELVDRVAAELSACGEVKPDRARELVARMQKEST